MFKKCRMPVFVMISIILSLVFISNRVHAEGEPNLALNPGSTGYPQATASYTCGCDSAWSVVNGIFSYNESPRDRWTNYGSPNQTDWLAIDFGSVKSFNQVKLYLFNDGGGVQAPASYLIEYWNGSDWKGLINQTKTPAVPEAALSSQATPETTLNMVNFDTVTSSKLRVTFTNKGGSYSGLVELEVLLHQTEDGIAAAAMMVQIEQLPIESAVALSDKSAITAARTAYNNLTENQKSLVTNLSKLTAAEVAIGTLEAAQAADESAAAAMMMQIEQLPIQSAVALSDKSAITAARTAYNNLTMIQKSLVTNLSRLTAAEAAIVTMEAAQAADESAAAAIMQQIGQLPIQSAVTLSDKSAITAARAVYNNLTENQKSLVTNLSRLTAAEAAIAALELPVVRDVRVLSAFSDAAGQTITLKLSSVLDVTYSIQASKFQIIANGVQSTATKAVYDLTDNSHQTIKLTFGSPVLLNETSVTLSLQGGAFKISSNEFNTAILSKPVITFKRLDLSGDNRIGMDDIVQMMSKTATQIDVNLDGVFNREDILVLLDQISTQSN
ncbi:hypothetical protein GC093_00780 [Paenibacillus sp. LMG 31456]|uniref:F5/8 type C domain-containing protein n=1 Tax=Paenibacillus foliorum TaxID=2654974 RepID=A0A972GKN8_9BACL|nr:discoidin domain-containing protein [Paenibacillus foliorum]NOU91775.1 hypothetical protein [Paenibacillus foliorum]